MTAFLDTGVLIALTDPQHPFHGWSVQTLQEWQDQGPTIITDIVFCEFSVGMERLEEVVTVVEGFSLERIAVSDDALFRAGKAFHRYKKVNQGPKAGVLPDFLIGATAETAGHPLITINSRDFVGYFPQMKVICP